LPNTIDGGAIVFKDKALYEKAKLIRDYGINRSIFRNSDGEINPECDIKLPGYGGLMSELNSYVGTKQMEDIEGLLTIQRNNAKGLIKDIMKEKHITMLSPNSNVNPNYWVFGLLCEHKTEAINSFKEKGFYATGVHINNNVYSVFNNNINLKGVNEFMNHFVAIPCGWWLYNNNDNKL
jgi:dTDP-4-amino-4,6-dideoxygalactose transaminase